MAANVYGLHVFANDVGPVPLALLDQNYTALVTALNTLSTFSNFYADSGTTNQLTVQTLNTQFVSLTDGLEITVRVAATNTGASTLNVAGLGAQPILTSIGSELQPNALLAGSMVTFIYNAQRTAWQIASGGGGGQITAPLHVTNPTGQSALSINPDGSGYLGDFNGNGLSWDAACHFNFDGGATLSGVNAPFSVSSTPGGQQIFTVNNPVEGSGTPLVTITPGSGAGDVQSGPTLLLDGQDNYPVLVIDGATHTQPDVPVAVFNASCGAPGNSNGIFVTAGTNASDKALLLTNCAGAVIGSVNGDGSWALGPAPNQLVMSATGAISTTGTATLPMPPLIDLPGISITNPQDGEALVYDSANNQWVNGAPVNALATLNDVALTNPLNGQSLTYSTATQKWVNSAPVLALEGLTNTHISGPAPGQVLTYSLNPLPGWVNATIPGYTFLTNLGVGPNPQPGWVLTWDGAAWVGAAPGEVAQFPLSSLTDVGITTPLNRQVLTYDAPSGKWINAPAPSPSLATLPDVALTSQTQGQVLAWNATALRWENSSLPGGSVIALDTLMDTNISDPQNNQVLTWDYASSRWVNRALPPTPALAGLPDVALASPTTNQVLEWNGTAWANAALPAGAAVDSLSKLHDVALTTPANGQALTYNGTNWVNANQLGSPTSLLQWDSNNQWGFGVIPGRNVRLGIGAIPGGNGLYVDAGGTTTGVTFCVYGNGGSPPRIRVQDDGSGFIGSSSTNRLQWDTNGSFTIYQPLAGPALTVNALSGQMGVVLAAPSGVAPGIAWQQAGRTQWQMIQDGGTDSIRLWNNGSGTVWSATNTGNVSISVPNTGHALTVNAAPSGYGISVVAAANGYGLYISGSNVVGSSYGMAVQAGTNTSDVALSIQARSGSPYFTVRGDGATFTYGIGTGTGGAVYVNMSTWQLLYQSSSGRYKTNIRSLTRKRARQVLSKLRAVSFNPKGTTDDPDSTHYGLIAEEVEKIDRNLIAYDKDGRPETVNYQETTMLLLPLLQELLGMDEPEGEVYG